MAEIEKKAGLKMTTEEQTNPKVRRKKREEIKSVREIQDEIAQSVEPIQRSGTKEDLLAYIMQLGSELPPMPEEMKTDSSLVYGCVSRVWISFLRNKQPGVRDKRVVHYVGDADSEVTRGIVALLFKIFDKQKYDAIIKAELYVIDRMGLISLLGHQRALGLANIIKHIKMIALLEKTRPRRGRKPKEE